MLLKTDYGEIFPVHRGKVRDIYTLDSYLLIVSTDRISAFDFVLPDGIPYKGYVLNQLSAFWFRALESIVPHHMVTTELDHFKALPGYVAEALRDRAMITKKAKPLPVECIVRGYLAGSGWQEYRERGTVAGIRLPEGLKESARLPAPLFSPSTKADAGAHDENIDFSALVGKIGRNRTEEIQSISIRLYQKAAAMAEEKGILIADTKFEFGLDDEDHLILIDEALTPDSSRFWPLDDYAPGRPQKSFDKQYVRDYLLSLGWDKKPPIPNLPEEVIRKTSEKYLEAYKRLTCKVLLKESGVP